MKSLQSYYIKQVLLYVVLSLLLLCVVYVAIDLISNFRRYGNTLPEILENFSLKLPFIIYQMQAVSLFLASMVVLSLIYSRREYLILGTSGISLKEVFAPVVLIILGISVLFCGLHDILGPKIYIAEQMRKGAGGIGDNFQFSFINTKVWYQDGNQIYHVGYIYPDSGVVEDVQIFFLADDFELKKYIQAQRAVVFGSNWNFENGLMVEYQDRAPGVSEQFQSLQVASLQDLDNLKKIQFDPRQLRLDQLFTHLIQKRFRASEEPKYVTDFYQRIVFAFFPLILFYFGAPLVSVRKRHTSLLLNVGMTFILSVAFWTSFKIFVTIGSSGKLSPLFAVLCVPVIFIGVGTFLWRRTN